MKKDLPNNPLRDQLDSVHNEFEEAHWDKLASHLHMERGGAAGEEGFYQGKIWWYLGTVLFGLILAGGIYWSASTAKEPRQNKPVVLESMLPINPPREKTTMAKSTQEIISAQESQSEIVELTNALSSSQNQPVNKPSQIRDLTTRTGSPKPTKNTALNENSTTKNTISKIKKSGQETREVKVSSNQTILNLEHQPKPPATIAALGQNINSAGINSATKELEKQHHRESTPVQPLATRALPAEITEAAAPDLLPPILWPEKTRKFRFGFLTGFNFSNGKPGLTFGLSIKRQLRPQWSVALNMAYRGSHIDHWEMDPTNVISSYPFFPNHTAEAINLLKYVDFPLLIQWHPQQRFTFYAGPKLAFLSGARGRVVFDEIVNSDPLNPVVEQRVSNGAVNISEIPVLRTREWGAVLGAMVHLDKNIGLGLRGHFGFTSFSDPIIVKPSPQKRNMDLQFLVQLNF